jgi:cbb3-type cytochrome oxidase subunit 1
MGGRARGGTGLFGWIRKLPWGDPSLTAQLLAMITFVYGGATGLINASFSMNLVIHNTTWVPGHFHMTVGTAVALTLMGVGVLDDPVPHRAGAVGTAGGARLVLDLHDRRADLRARA